MNIETIKAATEKYLAKIETELSANSFRTYRNALSSFVEFLGGKGLSDQSSISTISVEWFSNYVKSIQEFAPSTQYLYMTVIFGWLKFLVEENKIPIEISEIRNIIQENSNLTYSPQPVLDFEIVRVVEYITSLDEIDIADEKEKLRVLRDRAIILTLSDTGFEGQTICNLTRGNYDFRRKLIQIDNETGTSTTTRISLRLHEALIKYLDSRLTLDVATGQNIRNLPIFARHDRGAGRKIKGISVVTVRNVVSQRVQEALGFEVEGIITPRSFKNYFVTSILRRTFELLHPKILDRCQDLFESGQYDEAIFNAMKVVEEEIRSKASARQSDIGFSLISKTMNPSSPIISFSSNEDEQKSAFFLYSGAIGSFKNPLSHRFLDTTDPIKTYECISMASMLIRMLENTT